MQMEGSSIDRLIKKGQKYSKQKNSGARVRQHTQGRDKDMQRSAQCFKCGGPFHARAECPANDAKCRGCGKKGHYQRVCRNKAVVACNLHLHKSCLI
uniref:CCHC-type domain-containing protein n=1 Tax=Fundulus heteroclitus TaxID=8078 RepID=A0A3Q2Q2Q7_FUNHE